MDLYLVFKIGILIFGLISWFLYKSDRSINKNVLNDHIRQRELIRDLTVEELELLQPFLTSKLAVYPYNFQSSLIDNKVSYLLGTCTRKSLYSNTDEIAYYYDVDNIELFFPYNMDLHIDESNIFEVVFTKHYGIVIKVNDYDIKAAFENYDPNEEYLFRDVKQTKYKEKIFDNEFFEEHNTTHRQDATFNIAGVIFPLITTYALTHDLSWATSYLTVGIVTVLMLVIILFTNFNLISKPHADQKQQSHQKSEWNFGILSAGFGLFLAMLALYTFLTWAPLFVSYKFSISFENAGNIITRYWGAALIGALVSTAIVTRIKIEYFFVTIIILAFIMTLLIVNIQHVDYIGYFTYGYGFVCAALYNAFVAYGVTFVKNASSKNVSYILISGSAGAMFSPAISSVLSKYFSIQIIMNAIPVFYVIIILMLAISMIEKKRISSIDKI